MKKLLVLAIVLWPMMAWGFTSGTAFNYQEQAQNMGAIDGGSYGMASGIDQSQLGYGYSVSDMGSASAEGQVQVEQIDYTFSNGAASHQYDSITMTSGFSGTVDAGIAGHEESSVSDFNTLTVGVGGQVGVGGADSYVSQSSASGVLGGGSAGTDTAFEAHNDYKYFNAGTSSYTYHVGNENVVGYTSTRAGGGFGGGTAKFTAEQAGATFAANDGSGGSMVGASVSKGSVDTKVGSIGNAGAHAGVEQSQFHGYQQEAVGAGTYQYQAGYTSTYNREEQ